MPNYNLNSHPARDPTELATPAPNPPTLLLGFGKDAESPGGPQPSVASERRQEEVATDGWAAGWMRGLLLVPGDAKGRCVFRYSVFRGGGGRSAAAAGHATRGEKAELPRARRGSIRRFTAGLAPCPCHCLSDGLVCSHLTRPLQMHGLGGDALVGGLSLPPTSCIKATTSGMSGFVPLR